MWWLLGLWGLVLVICAVALAGKSVDHFLAWQDHQKPEYMQDNEPPVQERLEG